MEEKQKLLFIGSPEGFAQLAKAGLHREGFEITGWLNRSHTWQVPASGGAAVYYPQFAAVITELNLEALGLGEKGGLDVPGSINGVAPQTPVMLFGADIGTLTLDHHKKFTAILTRGGLPETLRSEILNVMEPFVSGAAPAIPGVKTSAARGDGLRPGC